MKTISTLTAALLIILSVSAFASDEPIKEIKKTKVTVMLVKAPTFVWGNPDATSTPFVSFSRPAFEWGNPGDIHTETLKEMNKPVSFPEFVWGDPEEATAAVEPLKITFPEFVWGDPQEID